MSGKSKSLKPEHFAAAIEATFEAYPRGNAAGVFGACIQRKRTHGRRQRSWTVAVFVERKHPQPSQPVQPLRFRLGEEWVELLPDVVATGQRAAAAAGESPHFSGLHAGAALRVDSGHSCAGGVACLLTKGSEPTHLLTAGHVFPEGSQGVPVLAAVSSSSPPKRVGQLAHNLLDGRASMDVALVELNDDGVQMALASGAAARLPRLQHDPFNTAFVASASLRVFLPTTGDYQGHLEGQLHFNRFTLESGCRPDHEVRNVITTGFAHNTPGNSGTILMTDGPTSGSSGHGVGIAIGFAGDLSLHEPLDQALEHLRGHAGAGFRIWSQP
jgi:hypothetical protein